MRTFILGLIAAGALAPTAHAEEVRAVRTLDGYVCMNLNLPDARMRDPAAPRVPIRVAPSPDAAVGTLATPIVIARTPEHVVDGYAEVLQLTGKPGWIEANMIVPYRSASNPFARCTPSLLSNGRIGTG
jgi:hypothetical protein